MGALGILETLALQIGQIQHTLTAQLNQPTILLFAGDHGITQSNVSTYPQSVTAQMVLNFLKGGAAINVFATQQQLNLRIIDAGVNHIFAPHVALIDAKIAMGTANFLTAPAMTSEQCQQALTSGPTIAKNKLMQVAM